MILPRLLIFYFALFLYYLPAILLWLEGRNCTCQGGLKFYQSVVLLTSMANETLKLIYCHFRFLTDHVFQPQQGFLFYQPGHDRIDLLSCMEYGGMLIYVAICLQISLFLPGKFLYAFNVLSAVKELNVKHLHPHQNHARFSFYVLSSSQTHFYQVQNQGTLVYYQMSCFLFYLKNAFRKYVVTIQATTNHSMFFHLIL